ncbi:hypothetical protein vseg_010042 [Gypsophila vaccaria]
MDAQVDASRPFRSVKEAVAIFGDRLFLKEIEPSPTRPSSGEENEASYSYTSDLAPSPKTPTNPPVEQDVGLTFDKPSDSPESTLGPIEQVVKSPTYEVPPSPLNEQGVGSSLDQTSYSSDDTVGPTEPLYIASKQVVKSPTYESTPITENSKKDKHENIVHGNDLVMMMMVLKKLEVELQETKAELKLLKERGTETEVALASLNAELHKSMSKIAKAEAGEASKDATKSITNTNEGQYREKEMKDDETTRELMVKTMDSPTLAQILKISDYERYFDENKFRSRKLMKQKPIAPLVTDLFLWKKKASPNPGVSDQIFSKMYFT